MVALKCLFMIFLFLGAVAIASPPHLIPLTLVTHPGSDWGDDKILKLAQEAEQVFAQCAVQFSEVKLIRTELPEQAQQLGRLINIDTIEGSRKVAQAEVALASSFFTQQGVVVFFLNSDKSSRLRFAKAAWAYGKSVVEGIKKSPIYSGLSASVLANTAWMYSAQLEEGFRTRQAQHKIGEHSILAHELFHVMGDEPVHPRTVGKNLMHADGTMNDNSLLPWQCERLRAFPFLVE